MAQSFARHNHTPQQFTAENVAVSVAQTGDTTLLDMVVEGAEKMSVVVANTVQALDTFVVQVQFHRNAAYVTLFNAAGDFTAPGGRMLGASGDLTTLGVATGWFEMDVSGLYAVRILASGSNATASVTSIYATGGSAGQSNSNISLTGADTVTLAAGSAIAGKFGIDQTTPGTTNAVSTRDSYSAVVSVTRTNDTNIYAANDVIGAATGSTAALTFPSMGPSGGRIMITSSELEIDVTSVPSGMTSFRLHLYSVTPPSALGDNAPFDLPSGDRASYLGYISLGTPEDLGSTLYIATDAINRQRKLAGTSLFGYLVTVGGYTPAASAVKTITLHAVAV